MSDGLFQFDWDAPLSDEERDTLLEGIVKAVQKWRLEIPAALFLEASAPLGRIAGQGLVAFSPFVAPALPGGLGDVQRLHKFLDRPENLRRLIDLLMDTETNTKPEMETNAARE